MVSTESTGDNNYLKLAIGSNIINMIWEDQTDLFTAGSDRDIFYKKFTDTTNPQVIVNSPGNMTVWNTTAPSIQLSVYEPLLDKVWFQIGTQIGFLTSGVEDIREDIWADLDEGLHTIKFFANDTTGNLNDTTKVIINKTT